MGRRWRRRRSRRLVPPRAHRLGTRRSSRRARRACRPCGSSRRRDPPWCPPPAPHTPPRCDPCRPPTPRCVPPGPPPTPGPRPRGAAPVRRPPPHRAPGSPTTYPVRTRRASPTTRPRTRRRPAPRNRQHSQARTTTQPSRTSKHDPATQPPANRHARLIQMDDFESLENAERNAAPAVRCSHVLRDDKRDRRGGARTTTVGLAPARRPMGATARLTRRSRRAASSSTAAPVTVRSPRRCSPRACVCRCGRAPCRGVGTAAARAFR